MQIAYEPLPEDTKRRPILSNLAASMVFLADRRRRRRRGSGKLTGMGGASGGSPRSSSARRSTEPHPLRRLALLIRINDLAEITALQCVGRALGLGRPATSRRFPEGPSVGALRSALRSVEALTLR